MLLKDFVVGVGLIGICKGGYGLIQTFRCKQNYLKNIHLTRMPNMTDKYVIKHILSPNEKFNHVFARGQMKCTNIIYNMVNDNNVIETKICNRHIDHNLPYCFTEMDKLYWSYDDKHKNVTRMSLKKAKKYFTTKYNQNMSPVDDLVSIYNIYEYTADTIYLFGSNVKDKFIVEGVGSNLRMIDDIMSEEYHGHGNIFVIGLALFFVGLIMIYMWI
jgi:hypothetical protein